MLKILTVAGLATFEIYAAIPAGYAFELSPLVIFFAALTGGIAGVFVAAFLGEKIEAFIARYRKPKTTTKEKKPNMAHKLWDKHGIVGLGVLGTFLVGAPVSIAVGVGFNVNMHKLAMWCCVGVLARCIVYTTLGYYGAKMFD
ncbi:MAG TPA: small multi-drug export protein [Ferruginibacter sp.]|nr:small multi-drug export protein [Ferruginibacter sp.]